MFLFPDHFNHLRGTSASHCNGQSFPTLNFRLGVTGAIGPLVLIDRGQISCHEIHPLAQSGVMQSHLVLGLRHGLGTTRKLLGASRPS